MPEQHDPRWESTADVSADAPTDERDRRIEALRGLAQEGESARGSSATPHTVAMPTLKPVTTRRRSRGPLLVAGISLVVLLAVAGGLLARAITTPSSGAHTAAKGTTYTFRPIDANLYCPKDVTWSPSGKAFALLGYQKDCPFSFPDMYAYHPGIVAFYDGVKGMLTGTLAPDPLIASALHLKPPTVATPMTGIGATCCDVSQQVIDYAHLLWSPDSQQVALTFSIQVATADLGDGGFAAHTITGVLLCGPSGGQPRVLSHTLANGEFDSGLWNLSTGAYIPQAGAPPSGAENSHGWYTTPTLLPPASGYQWDSNGKLQPMTPLNAATLPTAQPTAPVGTPDGGASFSVWQPGYAQLLTYAYSTQFNQTPPKLATPIETWNTGFAAWSQDGKSLFAGSQGPDILAWRMPLDGKPATDQASLTAASLVGSPVLPPRDAGQAAALQRYYDISQDLKDSVVGRDIPVRVNLAWSPDGKQLAAEAFVPSDSGLYSTKDFAVRIYDCASGKLLRTLVPNVGLNGSEQGLGQEMTFLRWTADGSRLLFYDPGLESAQVWGPQELPK